MSEKPELGSVVTTEKEMTPADMSTAKLIGVLMMLAKTMEPLLLNGKDSLDPIALKTSVGRMQSLITTTLSMFPEAGMLERETLALGKRMGFEIEQHLVPAGAKKGQ